MSDQPNGIPADPQLYVRLHFSTMWIGSWPKAWWRSAPDETVYLVFEGDDKLFAFSVRDDDLGAFYSRELDDATYKTIADHFEPQDACDYLEGDCVASRVWRCSREMRAESKEVQS